EEIKRAVWDCGIDKAPGPDGFTFGFYLWYWDIIGASKYGIYSCAFFNGADVNIKKPIWVRWKSVLAAKDVGGLRVSSLFALNRELMFKWVWRFFSQKNSLWVRVVKALHGEDEKIGKKVQPRALYGEEFLRKPTYTDIEKLYAYHEEKHGFPSMMNNDVNALHKSPVFNDLKLGRAPDVPFVANNVPYKRGYYLTDGIHPQWLSLGPCDSSSLD
nr:RNA-directed DNA polymerase, eukaryota, reverse transcriptase zinc-binding domain protein [Tanacetum cinerariifolium]